MPTKRILILYHSGAGSTRIIAEVYYQILHNKYDVSILAIEDEFDYNALKRYDLLIFTFPTYHCEPSNSMMSFIQKMPVSTENLKAFVFTTYGLYSGNAIRIFVQNAKKKNITTIGYSDYKASATDATLLFPSFQFLYKYEKRIVENIKCDLAQIERLLTSEIHSECVPPFKLYTILNAPNKYMGKWYKPTIKLVENDCVKCNKCVKNCPNLCWSISDDGFPIFRITNCESCYRCVHHCPKNALLLSKNTAKKKKLSRGFYEQIKSEIIQKIAD